MFNYIKQIIIDKIENSQLEVTEKTNYLKTVGVYMIYIDSFIDDKILPIYIGQSDNIQNRYSAHFKEILALNRLTKEAYEMYHSKLFYNGRFKACKIFKYMVDNKCYLSDFKMIILEECEKSDLDLIERKYIKEFCSEYYGFNQLESISRQMKVDFRSKSIVEKQQIVYEELTAVDKYLCYGFTKFNFIFAYGMSDEDSDIESVKELKIKIRNRLSDDNKFENYLLGEVDDNSTERYKKIIEVIKHYMIPTVEYDDFPLKSREISIPLPKLKKNECGIYFVISNNNRLYGDTWHCAEVIKVLSMYVQNGEINIKEYFIDNNSINNYYYEKDFKRLTFRINPFQISTGKDILYMISLSTELNTGINDNDFRGKPLFKFNNAIIDILNTIPENYSFKLFSNQSKNVLNSCLLSLDLLLEEKIQNRISRGFNFENVSFLFIKNDLFSSKSDTSLLKNNKIKIKRVNDFERGLDVAKKSEFSFVFFKVNRSNDKALKVIRALSEENINSRIIVINNGGVKTQLKLNELKNVELYSFVMNKDFLKKLLL